VLVTAEEIEYLEARYDEDIAYVDSWVGEILDLLDERGLQEDTFVVFTSDHGESFGEHGQFGHAGRIFNDQLHVPMIVGNPTMFRHRRVLEQPVELIDLYTTLPLLAGLDVGSQGQGQDLSTGTPKGEAFSEGMKLSEYKVQTGDWSLTVDRELETFQLYDLSVDPGELANVAAERPEILESMKESLFRQIRANRVHPARIERGSEALDEEVLKELRALGYLQ
jgi:arylsulfatase A-like enzyme